MGQRGTVSWWRQGGDQRSPCTAARRVSPKRSEATSVMLGAGGAPASEMVDAASSLSSTCSDQQPLSPSSLLGEARQAEKSPCHRSQGGPGVQDSSTDAYMLFDKKGRFMPTHIGAETDLLSAICSMLKDWSDTVKEKWKKYILNYQVYEDGFCMVSGSLFSLARPSKV